MSGEYPLFTLLPELLGFGSDNPKSVHNKEFCVLFRTKNRISAGVFLDQTCKRNKHISMLSVIRTSLMGTETL